MTGRFQIVALNLVLATLYFFAGKFGLSLAFMHASASAVWPPTGMALAALLLWGNRLWPGVFLGAFLVNITTQGSVATTLGIATGNTLEALLGAWLVSRFAGGTAAFERARNIFKYIGLAAILSTAVSASLGVSSLCLGGFALWDQYGAIWLTWWLGDVVSNLIVAPLLIIWATAPRGRLEPRQMLEGAVLVLVVVWLGQFIFLGRTLWTAQGYPLEYLAIPPLLWAAFRFGTRGASSLAVVMSGIALAGTLRGFGPFALPDPNESLLLLQAFMGTITMTALVLAAVVAERARTEAALRESEGRLQLALAAGRMGAWEWSPVTSRVSWSASLEEIHGLKPGSFGGRFEDFKRDIHPEDLGPVLDQTRKTVEKRGPYHVVYRMRRPEGTVRWLEAFGRIFLGPGGDETLAGVCMDITERKEAEQRIHNLNAELQRRVEEFQALIDTAPIGIAVATDPACRQIWGNPEFAKMLGTEVSRNISKSAPGADVLPFRIFHEGKEVRPEDLPMQRACREAANILDEELEIVRAGGTIIYELCRATPLLDERGNVRGCIGVFLDITARRQAGAALRQARDELARANEDLEKRVSERTAELLETNSHLEAMAYTIAHDLRAPLRYMQAFSKMLLDEYGSKLDEIGNGYARKIVASAESMDALILDLLAYGRVARSEMALDTVHIQNAWTAALDQNEQTIRDTQARVEALVPLAPVRAHETTLAQALANLLSNALRFVAPGTAPQIRFWAEDRTETVRLWIEDNGIGIAPEHHERIFRIFEQLHGREYGGTGIGLSIVRKGVERMGGRVGIESAAGQGSRFWIELRKA